MDAETLVKHLLDKAEAKSRFMVAVAGPPGAGKSTLAEQLHQKANALGQRSKIVPMDGFHLDNAILQQRNLLSRKGAPETFDANGFVHLVERLASAHDDVFIPTFDRKRDIAVAGADCISTAEKFLFVEGNYLLLNSKPWQGLQKYWNETVFINPGLDVLERRLVQRWRDHGHDEKAAQSRAQANDLPNARLVLDHSVKANIATR